MLLKVGVNFDPDQKLLPVLRAVSKVFKKHGHLMIITSMKDREHSAGSLHYVGKAFDLRVKHIEDVIHKQELFEDINEAIYPFHGIIIEEPTHWHIQVNK
jgi:hypothetical protein